MAMPHPGMYILPFGCVVCQRLTKSGTILETYLDADEIRALHKAFKSPVTATDDLASTIINVQDDPRAIDPVDGNISVLWFANIALNGIIPNNSQYPYQAYRLHSRAAVNATPKPVPSAADPYVVMESNWLYFLLPSGVTFAKQKLKKDHERGDE
jgi:hypothetical protein